MDVDLNTKTFPVLIGDIGGTNSRLSIVRITSLYEDETNHKVKSEVLSSQNYKSINELLKHFLRDVLGTENYPIVAVIGMAGPVFNNTIDIIANISWPKIKGEELAVEFNIKKFIFLNDFVINGYGLLSNIKEGEDYIKLNDKKVDPNGPIVMIGAGTGLGHGYIVKGPNDKYYNVYPSEGGHQDFCPQTERHWRYHEYLKQFYKIDHVSIERACAGPVIPVMFKYFVEVEKMTEKSPLYDKVEEIDFLKPEVIVKAGIDGSCNISVKVLEFFSELYGAAAGNMSLLLLPTGGVYLLGSLSVSLEQYTKSQEVFTQSYCNKGRLRPLLQEIPLYLVKNTFIGMKGAHVRIF